MIEKNFPNRDMLITGILPIRTELPSTCGAGFEAWLQLWGAMSGKDADLAISCSSGIERMEEGFISFPLNSRTSVVAAVYFDIEIIFIVRLELHDQ